MSKRKTVNATASDSLFVVLALLEVYLDAVSVSCQPVNMEGGGPLL